MPVNFAPSASDMLRFAPETILTIAGTLLMVLDPVFGRRKTNFFGNFTIAALLVAIYAAWAANSVPGVAFSNLLVVDGFGTYFRILVMAIGILTVLSSYKYLCREEAETGEYHALILFSVMGQCVMV